MQRHSTFEEAFRDFANQQKKPSIAPPRPFGALLRDMTISNLMAAPEEAILNHQDALTREAVLSAPKTHESA